MIAYATLQATSLHEAGHAVAALALGGAVEYATAGGETGEVLFAESPPLEGEGRAVALLAGAVAAREFGPAVRSVARDHSEQDLRAAALALGVPSLTPSAVRRLEAQARSVLLSHDGAVHRVAQALRTRETLTGAEVAHVVAGGLLVPSSGAVVRGTPAAAASSWDEEPGADGVVRRVFVSAAQLSAVCARFGVSPETFASLNSSERLKGAALPLGSESAWVWVR